MVGRDSADVSASAGIGSISFSVSSILFKVSLLSSNAIGSEPTDGQCLVAVVLV